LSWIEFAVEVNDEQQEALSDWLFEQGAVAVSLRDAADVPILEPGPGETPLWPEVTVAGLFVAESGGQLMGEALTAAGYPQWQSKLVPEQEWSRVGREQFKPQQISAEFWICPSWSTPPDSTAATLMLDPGVAFGTGEHGTTALCLRRLAELELAGLDVIDYGCGSGILALAALKLGAARVRAVDIDPQALRATAENARRNDLDDQLEIISPEALESGSADLVVANILLGPLLALRDRFLQLLRPGGRLLMTGILQPQGQQLRMAYEAEFSFELERVQSPWLLLQAEKRY